MIVYDVEVAIAVNLVVCVTVTVVLEFAVLAGVFQVFTIHSLKSYHSDGVAVILDVAPYLYVQILCTSAHPVKAVLEADGWNFCHITSYIQYTHVLVLHGIQ